MRAAGSAVPCLVGGQQSYSGGRSVEVSVPDGRGAEGTVSKRAHACISGTVQVQGCGVAEEDAGMSEYWTALQIFSSRQSEPMKMPVCSGDYLIVVKRQESEPKPFEPF